MLNILGQTRTGYCDGVTRRDFLKIGGLALGGLSLPGLLRAEDRAGLRRSHKAVIMIFLAGGPPHQDMVRPQARGPRGIRGEFRPIPTNVPGLEICEHMPRLARMMDKFVVIRSLVGAGGDHSAGQCMTGYKDMVSKAQGGRPSLGAIVSRAPGAGASRRADVRRALAAYRRGAMEQPRRARLPGTGPRAIHALPDRVEGDQGGRRAGLSLDPAAIAPTRLASRRSLLGQLDGFRRAFDQDESVRGMEASRSGPSRCSPPARSTRRSMSRAKTGGCARYGIGDMTNEQDGPPCCMDQFLMARRLVEAGARVVTIGFGRWDTHSEQLRDQPPPHPEARHGPLGPGRGPPRPRAGPRTSRSSSGASSAGPRPSTSKPAATTGPRSTSRCWPAAG